MNPLLDDEEARVSEFTGIDRRQLGAYFTPAPLVNAMFDCIAPLVPRTGALAIVDPACGAGAFLSAASQRFPNAHLLGADLSPEVAAACSHRLPRARIVHGDALHGALRPALERLPPGTFELWIGNPPYNGTSPLLSQVEKYRALKAKWPESLKLPRGTSLRDDFAFFLLEAFERLSSVPGAIAFITPSSLLDSYLYAPLRKLFLERARLHEVWDLGAGVFSNTRVRTCVTFWTSNSLDGEPRYRSRPVQSESFHPDQLSTSVRFSPEHPDCLLRPATPAAAMLDAEWTASGQPLTTLIPISFPGLKTRFDELLVDDDRDRLSHRIQDFLKTSLKGLSKFAHQHEVPFAQLPKLERLHADIQTHGIAFDASKLRPFFRYAGARHRDGIPESSRAWCYLERRLIPRGDHRFRGDYDPHACPTKLVFNLRELPLAATVVDVEGCVHAHRHARFAPLWVPRKILERGLSVAKAGGHLGPLVPNLSPEGSDWSKRVGGDRALFARIAAFINSSDVQDVWAPALGASSVLPIPSPGFRHHRRS